MQNEKLQLIASIFKDSLTEVVPNDSSPLQHGKYYGGVYNGRKHMFSSEMIEHYSLERLEQIIKKQISYETTS